MALMPIVHRTQINLVKSESQAGKNLKKVLAAGEGRAQRNLQKLLDRRRNNSRGNSEKPGMRGFFYLKEYMIRSCIAEPGNNEWEHSPIDNSFRDFSECLRFASVT